MLGISMGVLVSRDEGVREVELASFDRNEASLETRVTGFHAFDLASGQYQASLIVIHEGIVETRSFVGSDGSHSDCSMPYQLRSIKRKETFLFGLFRLR